jgi:hypothetical protein
LPKFSYVSVLPGGHGRSASELQRPPAESSRDEHASASVTPIRKEQASFKVHGTLQRVFHLLMALARPLVGLFCGERARPTPADRHQLQVFACRQVPALSAPTLGMRPRLSNDVRVRLTRSGAQKPARSEREVLAGRKPNLVVCRSLRFPCDDVGNDPQGKSPLERRAVSLRMVTVEKADLGMFDEIHALLCEFGERARARPAASGCRSSRMAGTGTCARMP